MEHREGGRQKSVLLEGKDESLIDKGDNDIDRKIKVEDFSVKMKELIFTELTTGIFDDDYLVGVIRDFVGSVVI